MEVCVEAKLWHNEDEQKDNSIQIFTLPKRKASFMFRVLDLEF